MVFSAQSTSKEDFMSWVADAKSGTSTLSYDTYTTLAQPSVIDGTRTYSAVQPGLYTTIMNKYMHHSHNKMNNHDDHMNMEHN
jgi:hypothetical protein